MSLLLFVKALGDACLYFSAVSMIPGLFSYDFPFWIPGLLCGMGVGLSALIVRHRKGWLRLLAAVIPLASLLLADTPIELMILLPVLVYACWLIIRGNVDMEYYSFREFFKISLIIWFVVYLVIWLMYYFEGASASDRGILDALRPLACMAVYAVCGVLQLRQLRMGDTGAGSALLNGLQMTAVFSVAGIFAWGLAAAGRWLEVAKHWIITALVAPFIALADFLRSLFTRTESQTEHWAASTVPTVTEVTSELEPLPTGTGAFQEPVPQSEQAGFPWWLAVLILLILTAVLILISRVLHNAAAKDRTEEKIEKASPVKRRSPPENKSNRAKLRQIYRAFLKRERLLGVRLFGWDTSERILAKLSPETDPAAAAKLRELYILARYDPSADITEKQVKEAREAWRSIARKP